MAATKTRARTTAPKKTPSRPVAVARKELDALQPIRIVTPETPPAVELVEVFSIDDTTYSIPRDISPSVSLRLMKVARTAGMEIAMGMMLEEVLGEEAYDALANCPHVSKEQFADVMELVRHHVMGPIENPKGTSKSA